MSKCIYAKFNTYEESRKAKQMRDYYRDRNEK